MWFGLFADSNSTQGGPPPPDNAAAQDTPAEYVIDADIGEEVNDVLQLMLPWMIALLVHLGVIVLALFVAWSVLGQQQQQDIIPIARLTDNPAGSLAQSQSLDLKALEQVRTVQTEQVQSEQSLSDLVIDETALELVGVTGGAARLAPLGTMVSADGLGTTFYGAGGNAHRIMYIVDASGSLIDTLPFVIKELKRSVNELSDRQDFNVIFFQAGDAIEVPPRGWKRATGENKKAVADWITLESGNIIPHGSTNPTRALDLAMKYQPELVYILSDNITGRGRYEINRVELLRQLDQANKERRIKINTIQFMYPDPLDTLRQIAEAHGGIYTFVAEKDLGLQ